MNLYKMFFVQTSTPPQSIHQKLTEHGRCCIPNNQLPIKSFDQLENNSNAVAFCEMTNNYEIS